MTNVEFITGRQKLRTEKQGVSFIVRGSDGKAGELVVSKGGLRWFPKWKQKKNFKVSWAKLERLFEEMGRPEK
ncbi:MAG: hypothetical protein KGO53_08960 [Alphaproteobacteria bacterium]|nr:hypothetical protein [Alphaproteobacteria bacterium]